MLNPDMIPYVPAAGGTVVLPDNLNQAVRQEWDSQWRMPLQQKVSVLRGSGLVIETDFDGLAKNYLSTGKAELVEVATRNPDIVYKDPQNENRQIRMKRFQAAEMYDVVADKAKLQSGFIEKRIEVNRLAVERLYDSIGVAAIAAARIIGTPFQSDPITQTSAEDDGMMDLGTQVVNYALITALQANAQNKEATQEEVNSAYLLVSANEEALLKQDEKFINNQYNTPVPAGTRARGLSVPSFNLMSWAGSKTGGVVVNSPILPEAGGDRSCYFMLPNSLVMAYHVHKIGIEKVSGKLNSIAFVLDLTIAAMVIDGNRTQTFQTQI